MEMLIPTVTVDDLRAFHAQHFPHVPEPEHILHNIQPEAAEEYYGEDDGLGYYPDGTKRTLTDEQIAMFRHTEIQTILRKRRLRKENGELSEGELDPASPALDVATPASVDSSTSMAADTDKPQPGPVEEPKKQQWATTSAKTKAKSKRKRANYAARRKERRLEKGLPRRRSGRDDTHNDDGEDDDDESDEWDPWHQANGPDVQKDETLDLDY